MWKFIVRYKENVQMKIFAKMINFVWLKCWFWCDQISKCHWLLVFFFCSVFFILLLTIILEKQMNNSYFGVDGTISKGWCRNEVYIGLLEIFFRNANVYYTRRMYKKVLHHLRTEIMLTLYYSKDFLLYRKVALVGGDEWCCGN